MEMLAEDFISRGYCVRQLPDFAAAERIYTYLLHFKPSVVLMYTLTPSSRTCLSVATLGPQDQMEFLQNTYGHNGRRPTGDTTVISV